MSMTALLAIRLPPRYALRRKSPRKFTKAEIEMMLDDPKAVRKRKASARFKATAERE
jgi:hypothetical protein